MPEPWTPADVAEYHRRVTEQRAALAAATLRAPEHVHVRLCPRCDGVTDAVGHVGCDFPEPHLSPEQWTGAEIDMEAS
jgi:hypothetical protein